MKSKVYWRNRFSRERRKGRARTKEHWPPQHETKWGLNLPSMQLNKLLVWSGRWWEGQQRDRERERERERGEGEKNKRTDYINWIRCSFSCSSEVTLFSQYNLALFHKIHFSISCLLIRPQKLVTSWGPSRIRGVNQLTQLFSRSRENWLQFFSREEKRREERDMRGQGGMNHSAIGAVE